MHEFILRNIIADDENFIYNSFLKSYHSTYPMKWVPDLLFFEPQSAVIDFLLDTQECLAAVYPEAPDQILGWVLYNYSNDALILHYIYTKGMYRNNHLATNMIKQIINDKHLIIATHICDNFNKLKHKVKDARVVFDPFYISKQMEIKWK